MALDVQRYESDLGDLPEFIRAASGVGGTAEALVEGAESPLELVGPFPVYSGDPREIAAGRWDGVEQSGWRALARRDGAPSGVVGIVEIEGKPAYSLRNAEAAEAFAATLAVATRLEAEGRDYEVRWFTLPSIYLTALWLKGEEDLFLPTRAGTAERPGAEPVSRSDVEKIVADLVEQLSRSHDESTAASLEGLAPDPGTRSGL